MEALQLGEAHLCFFKRHAVYFFSTDRKRVLGRIQPPHFMYDITEELVK